MPAAPLPLMGLNLSAGNGIDARWRESISISAEKYRHAARQWVSLRRIWHSSVSYTHLDVYKRQALYDLPRFDPVIEAIRRRGNTIELQNKITGTATIRLVTTDIAEALDGAEVRRAAPCRGRGDRA